ncbi:MAG: cellulase family glycosylhydrolase [Hyphomonadaceae bacterium]|nr:cellulase family glycosylhydrolase [Hyphomonadaceae bacterium]
MKRFRPENPHGNWTRRGVIAAAAGLTACSGPVATAQSPKPHPLWPTEGPPVLRGAVIAQRRRRLEVDGETFGGGGAVLPSYRQSDFDALAEAGANLVVMSFPELWTVKPPYRRDTAMADVLVQQLDAAKAAGLYSIVALRSGPGRSDFIFHRDARGSWFPENLIVESIWTNIDEQAAWAEMCVDAARLVAGRNDIAGLNLMVEPEPNVSGTNLKGQPLGAWEPNQYIADVSRVSDWRRISADIAAQVRAVSADLPILISPPAFARTDFLTVMNKPPVPGVVWCVHDYEPRDYTHHPRNAAGISVFSEGGTHTFASRVDAVRQQGVPLFLGEFGASRWLGDIDTYYRARIAACEARSMSWAAFRWPTGDGTYEKSDDMFNVLWGPNEGVAAGAATAVLQPAWAKNTVRPGSVGLRGRS